MSRFGECLWTAPDLCTTPTINAGGAIANDAMVTAILKPYWNSLEGGRGVVENPQHPS